MLGIHQLNAGSVSICCATAYSMSSIRLESFISLRGTQLVEPSFQCTLISQPLVVRNGDIWFPLWDRVNPSSLSMALGPFLWPLISLSIAPMWPSSSTCAYRFSAITFAEYHSIVPSAISMLYSLVSNTGLRYALPTGCPSKFRPRFLTVPCTGSPPRSRLNCIPMYLSYSG